MNEKANTERAAVRKLLTNLGLKPAQASRKAGLNHAYIHQYLKEGKPDRLSEKAREKLAQAFSIDPDALRDGSVVFREKAPVSPSQADPGEMLVRSIRAVVLPGGSIALQAKADNQDPFELILSRDQARELSQILQALDNALR